MMVSHTFTLLSTLIACIVLPAACTPDGCTTRFPKDATIGIVGGGIGGIHMASRLAKAGHTSIVIFEKANRTGGLMYTPHYKSEFPNPEPCIETPPYDVKKCTPFDTGGWLLDEGYHVVPALAEEYGLPKQRVLDIASDSETWRHGQPLERLPNQSWQAESLKYILEENRGNSTFMKLPAEEQFRIGWSNGMDRYHAVYQKFLGLEVFDEQFPDRPTDEALIELSLPFEEFMIKYNLTAMMPWMISTNAYAGFAAAHEPAFYGMYHFPPAWPLRNNGPPRFEELPSGWEALMKRMVESSGARVHLQANITHIDRALGDPSAPISVHYSLPDKEHTYVAQIDVLFWGAHASNLADCTVLTETESELFLDSDMVYSKMYTIVYSAPRLPTAKGEEATVLTYGYDLPIAAKNVSGFPRGSRYFDVSYHPFGRWRGDHSSPYQIRTAYWYGSDRGEEQALPSERAAALDFLSDNVNGFGFPPEKVEILNEIYTPNFYPHYGPEKLRKGYPWRIWDLQGSTETKTWYLGASVSVEMGDRIVAYNNKLLRSKICKPSDEAVYV